MIGSTAVHRSLTIIRNSTTALLAATAMLIASSSVARSQEAEASPTPPLSLRGSEPSVRSEPDVSVPSDRSYPKPGTPVSTPKPSPAATIAPAKPASPRATPSPSPRAKASPTARPASSPAPSVSPRAAASSVVGKTGPAALRELENKWAAATMAHDFATVQTLIAGDYIGVTASGTIVNKAGLLAEIRKDKNTYEAVTNSRVEVRMHGSAAVVVGTTKQRGKDAAGRPFSYTYRWTDTWVERNGQWQCVASQSIRQQG